jgi:hypothetical protein
MHVMRIYKKNLPQYLLNIIRRERFDKTFFGGNEGAAQA